MKNYPAAEAFADPSKQVLKRKLLGADKVAKEMTMFLTGSPQGIEVENIRIKDAQKGSSDGIRFIRVQYEGTRKAGKDAKAETMTGWLEFQETEHGWKGEDGEVYKL